MIKVYGAGKTGEADKWLTLMEETKDHIEWTNSWPKLHGKVPDTHDFAPHFWTLDEAEIRESDALLIHKWSNGAGAFRGALVECGMGLALSKPVFLISNWPEYGTWQHHPLCERFVDLTAAIDKLILMGNRTNRRIYLSGSIETIRNDLYNRLKFSNS